MTTRFRSGNELKSPFGTSRMKPYIPDWLIMLDGLRRMWEIGEVTVLETQFYEPFNKSKKLVE